MKKLIILDLKKNYKISRENCNYLIVNRGNIEFKNSYKIDFDINENKKSLKKNKKDLINYFLQIKKKLDSNKNDVDTTELEFFNLRNDKYNYLDKILVFYSLKKKKFFKQYMIEVITDQKNYEDFYKSTFGKKVIITNLIKDINSNGQNFQLFYKYLGFIVRAFYFLLLIKIFKKNRVPSKKSEFFLSFYPYFFKKNDIKLYNSKRNIYLNFSLTDETHLNLSPKKYFKHIKELSNNNRIISVEKFINFSELIYSLKRFYLSYSKFKCHLKDDFLFKGINCTNLIRPHLVSSYLNRSKLFIYEKTLNNFSSKFEPKKIHYFLFEYNFGFFLKNKLKDIKKFIGYQHGIYTKNLMWLDLINYNKKIYLPDTVIYNQKKSKKIYNKNFKDIFYKEKKINLDKNIKITKSQSSDILVYLGQHDMNDCIHYFLNNKKFKNKKIFFKLHPNNKIKISSPIKNFYLINKINKKNKFNVFLSPTTTMIYDFSRKNLKFDIIKFNYKINLWG